MKNIIPFSDKKTIQADASTWFAKLHRGDLSQTERLQLHQWLMQNPRHGTALIELAELWDDMTSLSLLAELLPRSCTRRERTTISKTVFAKPVVASIMAAAASVLLVLSIVLSSGSKPWLNHGQSVISEPYELAYQTQLGEQSRAQLKDGSSILLNTQTTVKVRYSDSERSVELIGGEAHFEVAKNADIPFVVYAGNGSIRAVGTAFSVRLDKQRVGVTVTEGSVQVVSGAEAATPSSPSKVSALTLRRNGEVYYSDSIENFAYIAPHSLEKKLAWKTGKWLFEGERLEDVIAEANRYLTVKLVIADPSIADLQVGGYFDIGDVGPLLSALEKGLGVTALPQNGAQIALIASSHY